MDIKQIISKLETDLTNAKNNNKLTAKGEELLNTIKGGGVTQGVLNSFLQGLTLSSSDELFGRARAGVTSGLDPLTQEVQKVMPDVTEGQVGTALERQSFEQFRETNPVQSYSAEIAGAAVPAILTRGKSLVSQGILPQMGAAGLAGGTAGFMASEGGIQERLPGAGVGVSLGAGLQGAVGVLKNPISNAYRGLINAFKTPKSLGTNQARALLKEAIDAENLSIDDAIQYVLEKSGKPYTLADIGPTTRAYLDAVALLPGPSKNNAVNFLNKRKQGFTDRLTTDLQKAYGQKAAFFDEYKALEAARKQTGDALYNAAYRKSIPLTKSLNELFKRPAMADAFEKAKIIAENNGVKLPTINIGPNGIVGPKGVKITKLDTKLLHYIKMGFDDKIFTSKSGMTGVGKAELGGIRDIKRELLEIMDAANPTYKKARNQWAEKASLMDAMDEGSNLLKASTKPNEVADYITDLSKSEKEAFRLGAIQSLLNRVDEGVDGTNLMRDVQKGKVKKLLRLTFDESNQGQARFDQFFSKLSDELDMRETFVTVVGNSRTETRKEALRLIREGAAKTVPKEIEGPVQLIFNAFQRDFRNANEKQLRATAEELSRILTETNPEKLKVIGQQLGKDSVLNVLREVAPELVPSVVRTIVNPVTTGQQAGQFAGNFDADAVQNFMR